MTSDLEPGTRVRLLSGPMGAVVFDRQTRFVEETFPAGYETDVSDVPHSEPGWIYLNTERDEVIIPVAVGMVEAVND